MDYRDRILFDMSGKECKRITRAVIRSLQQLGRSDGAMIGATVWDDICLQVQDEESAAWALYEEVIESTIQHYVADLPQHVREAIWLQTPEGLDWEPAGDDDRAPFSHDDIVVYILRENVLPAASDWSNRSIRSKQGSDSRARADHG